MGHADVVGLLLTKGANMHDKVLLPSSMVGLTSLMLASHQGHLNVVEMLVSKGANIFIKSRADNVKGRQYL